MQNSHFDTDNRDVSRGSHRVDNRKKQQKGDLKGKSAYKPLVPAVEQASRVLLCLGESPNFKMRLTEICKQVGIHKSKGHSILNTLKHFGFIEKDLQAKTYSLGPGLIFLSRNVLNNLHYPEIVAPFLENLAKETSGTALFGLINGEHIFVVAKHEGNQNVWFARLGHRFHITLGAHGKAIAAFMPEGEREKILTRKKVYFYGYEAPRVNIKRLKEELDRCRQLGYAQDVGAITPGVNFVSAPVFGLQEKIIGCIILIGTFENSLIDKYGPKTVEVAREVSYKLGADVKTLYRDVKGKTFLTESS
jgi:DNA-binding IclR family transcriptional regulator